MLKRHAIATITLLALLYTGCGKPREIEAEFVADIGKLVWGLEDCTSDSAEGWHTSFKGMGDSPLLVDDEGNVYIADMLRVQKFDSTGRVTAEFRPPDSREDDSARELYRSWFRFEKRKYESIDDDFSFKWDWERTEQDLEKEIGDFWEIYNVHFLDDERLLVCKDERLYPRRPEYFILDRDLNLLKRFRVRFPSRADKRDLRTDGRGWMLASWWKYISRDGGPMGMGIFETWIATVDENGKRGKEQQLRSDCGMMSLIPGRGILTLYHGEFTDTREMLDRDWNKWEKEVFSDLDEQEEEDFTLEWAILDESQDIQRPIRKSPKNLWKVDFVTDSQFLFSLSDQGGSGDQDRRTVLVTDEMMRPVCRILLPEQHTRGSIGRIALAGDYLVVFAYKSMRDEGRGVMLFKIDWPEDLRPAPPAPKQEEANEE